MKRKIGSSPGREVEPDKPYLNKVVKWDVLLLPYRFRLITAFFFLFDMTMKFDTSMELVSSYNPTL